MGPLDFGEFRERTGVYFDCDDIIELGLQCDSIIGTFWPSNMAQVFAFCRSNPNFHIVSTLGYGVIVNYYHRKGKIFQIASRDPSPDIWYDGREAYRQLLASIRSGTWKANIFN